MSPIRAVFFDVGGTLAYPHPSFHGVIARVLGEHGVHVTAEQVRAAEPKVWEAVEAYWARGGNFTRSDAESRRFWYWVYETFLRLLGEPNPGELPQRLYAEFIRHETYRLYPDSLPALEALRARGVLLGVISNWEEWLEQLLLHLQIHTYFASRTISGTAGVEKPDPRIFALALESLGVAPEEAAHVGDSLHHDVEGARRAGLTPVLIDRQGTLGPGDYLRVTDLAHLPTVLGLEGS
ncbi:MAG TPA: HAD-IA family hydrolase [Chloroflexota bacterium]|nr:HAD-IA family hydrolase [Chloroflexota bacterium]